MQSLKVSLDDKVIPTGTPGEIKAVCTFLQAYADLTPSPPVTKVTVFQFKASLLNIVALMRAYPEINAMLMEILEETRHIASPGAQETHTAKADADTSKSP